MNAAERDPEGRRWLAALPDVMADLCRRWDLEVESATPSHGYHGVVFPVVRGAAPYALKLVWPEGAAIAETAALRAWDGNGAVRLIAAQPERGALLLERLDAGRTLRSIGVMEAAAIAGALLRRLASPAPDGLPRLRETAARLVDALPTRNGALGRPVPAPWVDTACALCRDLGPRAGDRLVHGDLHYDNVLAGAREPWLAIDPKPSAGDPEYGVAEMLWTVDADPGRLLDVIVRSGGLDPARARGWALVRVVDYWLWGLENGLTEDPLRCRRIARDLV